MKTPPDDNRCKVEIRIHYGSEETITMASRCYYLDFTKVLATFLVILGHLYSPESTVRLYLYAFHMPLFFLVSGVFHKNTGKINWKRYWQTLIWPSLVCISLHILIGILFYHKTPSYFLKLFFIDLLLGKHEGVFWFIFALFWCKILMDVWLIVRRKVCLSLFWALLLFVPILVNCRLPLELGQGLMAFPFYVLGYYSRDFLVNKTPSVKYLLPFIICFTLNIVITRFHGRVSMMGLSFGQLARHFSINLMAIPIPHRLAFIAGDVVLFYLNGIIGSIMIMSLALIPIPKLVVISPLAQSLITVLGVQYIFITLFARLLGLDSSLWISILLSLGVFVLCYFTHLVLRPVYRLAQ